MYVHAYVWALESEDTIRGKEGERGAQLAEARLDMHISFKYGKVQVGTWM